jgi:hypothetical protein
MKEAVLFTDSPFSQDSDTNLFQDLHQADSVMSPFVEAVQTAKAWISHTTREALQSRHGAGLTILHALPPDVFICLV